MTNDHTLRVISQNRKQQGDSRAVSQNHRTWKVLAHLDGSGSDQIELVLAENQLLTVPDVLNLQKLKLLDMSFNKLQSLPKSITQAQVLEELLVNNNRISSLPEEIGRLQALRDFNLNANASR
eukprot:g1626.t1